MKKISDKLFFRLWKDALDQENKDLYIGEYGYPKFFDAISDDVSEIVDVLGNIHDAAHVSFRDLLEFSRLSQANFGMKFCIPRRTLQGWILGERSCPPYLRLYFTRSLGYLKY